jgi:hypothetical protein
MEKKFHPLTPPGAKSLWEDGKKIHPLTPPGAKSLWEDEKKFHPLTRMIPNLNFVVSYFLCFGKKYHRFMLLALPVVVVVVLFVAFWEQWLVWEILCVCSYDTILDDVLSSSWHSSSCRVSSIFWIVVDIRGLIANGISCPWLLFVWVVSYHLWRRLPLRCQSVVAWEVACVLISQVWFWCIPLRAPWCIVLQVLLQWLMTWHSWWCAWWS